MNRHGGRRRRRAQRIYRRLVRLYPAAHRRAFGEQMVQTFGDHYRDAVLARGGSRVRFWVAVLADTASSLFTEHTAELRARGWRQTATPRRRRGRLTRRGLRCRLRYRSPTTRPVRVMVRTRRHQLVYRGRIAGSVAIVALAGVALGTGTATGHFGVSLLVSGLLVTARLGYGVRLTRRIPAGSHRNGPIPPGGAGVREPRRPLPIGPAGSAARPLPEQDLPGHAAAVI